MFFNLFYPGSVLSSQTRGGVYHGGTPALHRTALHPTALDPTALPPTAIYTALHCSVVSFTQHCTKVSGPTAAIPYASRSLNQLALSL